MMTCARPPLAQLKRSLSEISNTSLLQRRLKFYCLKKKKKKLNRNGWDILSSFERGKSCSGWTHGNFVQHLSLAEVSARGMEKCGVVSPLFKGSTEQRSSRGEELQLEDGLIVGFDGLAV